jgi:Zn-dependent metalloprotease
MKSTPEIVAWSALAILALSGCSSPDPDVFSTGTAPELALAEAASLRLLEADLATKDARIARADLFASRVEIDDLAMAHTRVRQTVGGVPVFGGEAIVHLNRDGSLFAITDALVRDIKLTAGARPSLTEGEAIDAALASYGCAACLTDEPHADLWVLRRGGQDHLAYRVELRREDETDETALPILFLDAHSGRVIFRYDNLQTAQGASLYSGNVTLTTHAQSGWFYMEDIAKKHGTFDNRNTAYATYRFTDKNDVWDAAAQKAAVDVHFCTSKFLEFMSATYARNGIDGSGGPGFYKAADGVTPLISSKVHYGASFNNAFWNGYHMTYGDGDGVILGPLVSLDICGHEMTHGITQLTADLTYEGESGALNESFSDVFGALLERFVKGESADTWMIGEGPFTPGAPGDALRHMANPHAAEDFGFTANDDPDHYSERYVGDEDNGGVHINSGIANKAFYLLAVGGAHHKGGSMVGIGANKAGQIWYKALTTFMTSSTNFASARAATLNAASALYGNGSPEHTAVASAWSLCGVN